MTTIDEKLSKQAQTKGHMALGDLAKEGVTVAFLAQVFRMDANKVKRLLANCPVLETRQRGATQQQHLYDLATAAEFLVKPRINVAEVISRLRPEDLPPRLSMAFWDAHLKRQKYEENAGDLWRTAKVRTVLGTMFQTIKFTIQLWTEQLDRFHGLTKEQRASLIEMTDALQADIFQHLVENVGKLQTGPELADVPEMLDRAESGRPIRELAEVTAEDWNDLV